MTSNDYIWVIVFPLQVCSLTTDASSRRTMSRNLSPSSTGGGSPRVLTLIIAALCPLPGLNVNGAQFAFGRISPTDGTPLSPQVPHPLVHRLGETLQQNRSQVV